jgi:Cu(I)/Ag(I) efflux system membrane protein CusA/SilA
VAEGFYVNVEVNRFQASRYGLTVGDVQRSVESGIGGENIAENIEGRERYPLMFVTAETFATTFRTRARAD